MPFFALSILLQVALVLHIVRTGRNTTWIWIVVMLPVAGSIAYLVAEVLPEFTGSKTGRKATRSISKIVSPNRALNKAALNFSVSDTTENTMKLADELMTKRMYGDAKQLFEKCLKGIHKTDPHIMHKLALAEFELGNYQQALSTLDALIQHNPDFKNADAHLLYARTHEMLSNTVEALHEYEALHQYYPGPEATCRYASLCKTAGKTELANQLFSEIVKKSKTSGSHYNSLHKEWIRVAKSEIRS